MIALLNMIPFLIWGSAIAYLLWPSLGPWAMVVAAPVFSYPVYAFFRADRIIAGQAGFRPPSPLQRRYFDFLELDCEILTHPTLAVSAGVVAAANRKTILVTAGLTRCLKDHEIKKLVKGLAARDHTLVFAWTYHMATAGAMSFVVTPKYDYSSQWARLLLSSALVVGSLIGVILVAYINALNGAIPMIAAVMALLLPLSVVVGWLVWSAGVMIMSFWAANGWNKRIFLGELILKPMAAPEFSHSRLHLLRHGLVEIRDLSEDRGLSQEPEPRPAPSWGEFGPDPAPYPVAVTDPANIREAGSKR